MDGRTDALNRLQRVMGDSGHNSSVLCLPDATCRVASPTSPWDRRKTRREAWPTLADRFPQKYTGNGRGFMRHQCGSWA